MTVVDPRALLLSLCQESSEKGWLEFKSNRFEADETGQYVSGLANSAMLDHKKTAYLVFGVENDTHKIVGTDIRLKKKTVGSQLFEHWLARHIHPRISIDFIEFEVDSHHIEIIVIDPGYISPVRFKNEEYIRVDSVQQHLRDYSERERALWAITSRYSFEEGSALSHVTAEEIKERFHCEKLIISLNPNKKQISNVIDQLLMEGLILDDSQNRFDATNLLAIIAAKEISEFPLLATKAPRVITYKGTDKLHAIDDQTGSYGYGIAFSRLLDFIMGKIASKEEMIKGVRTKTHAVPEITVREILANALIHQDFMSQTDRPRVEIFTDKVRLTNPGLPLVSTDRFIDAPPKSRNKRLADLMNRMGLCEQRGSGIDRALDAIEAYALPAPTFQDVEASTVVTIFGQRSFAEMSREDRIRACYQHAALKYENGSTMSNASLRSRLGVSDKQYPQVSIVIRESIDLGRIRPLDEDQAKRNARYVPWYA
ncbi:transcriptional regulator [Lichenibacterium minor]|uniref:Transcriptional regulator n=1 Tax=Lichenibacterium minor TaxID=2316528 RepID=A0A4Q2U2Z3_9HYPH|nr:ATP-binding protein [Lichenibacterium minor]RYC30863.1 transcriptional regulator [Lichenibacterium minor]